MYHISYFFILITPSTAFAYFDPGTGSLIVQGFIAALLGGFFWIKTKWKKIISEINKLKIYLNRKK